MYSDVSKGLSWPLLLGVFKSLTWLFKSLTWLLLVDVSERMSWLLLDSMCLTMVGVGPARGGGIEVSVGASKILGWLWLLNILAVAGVGPRG